MPSDALLEGEGVAIGVEMAIVDVTGGPEIDGKNLAQVNCNCYLSIGMTSLVPMNMQVSLIRVSPSGHRHSNEPMVFVQNRSGQMSTPLMAACTHSFISVAE